MTNIGKGILRTIFIFSFLMNICPSHVNAQLKHFDCDFWQSKVNPQIKTPDAAVKDAADFRIFLKSDQGTAFVKPFNDLEQKEAFFAIRCLLNLQVNKNKSNLGGTICLMSPRLLARRRLK